MIQLKMKGNQQQPFDPYAPLCTFFLFVNSGSGGGLGNAILVEEINKIEFQIPIKDKKDIHNIHVHFINMGNLSSRDSGFRKLKDINQKNKNAGKVQAKLDTNRTIAIVCGGDGSVMWVVDQFIKYQIDFNLTPIGIIPIGTGNDFSRNLNWGPQKTTLLQNHYRSLKKLIRKWLHAQVRDFDLWDVQAEVYENGKIQKRDQQRRSSSIQSSTFRKTFCNYFSFGIDGKIGYSFDKYRAKSRWANLAIYSGLGFCKTFEKTKTIDELLDSFQIETQINQMSQIKRHQSTGGLRESKTIFRSKSGVKNSKMKQEQQVQQKGEIITPGFMNILALNINSFTGGTKDIWKNSKEILKENLEKRSEPSYSDGKIQIVSFKSGFGIGAQKFIGGFGSRLAQNGGPFIFNFHKNEGEQRYRTYLQIDGQFLRFTHPKSVRLQKSRITPNGKIKVIENDPDFLPYIPQNDQN